MSHVKPIVISKDRARSIILHAAGLAKPAQFGKGKEAVYRFIDHLGFLQIDTNYVVERAHHLAIAARVPDYKQEWLDQLQADGRLFEFWTFASGYIPMNDFRFSLPVKASFVTRHKKSSQAQINLMNRILDRIAREGPLMARDFENDRVTKSSGWWDWRPSKLALELLHLHGKLITTRLKNFQKRYDLPENIIPADVDITMPAPEEYARHVILRSLRALGIGYLKDVNYRGRYVKNQVKNVLQQMVEEGEICQVTVEGLKAAPLYMLPAYRRKKIPLSGDVFILSPFDTLIVLRHRLQDFFDFDYQVECFVPAKKRKYGYFSLPVLYGDTFIARMDSKADRKQRTLVINNLHFEPVKLNSAAVEKLATALNKFAVFNQCDTISIVKCNNKNIRTALDKKVMKTVG
jgi:uncharacterized protein YcaQ